MGSKFGIFVEILLVTVISVEWTSSSQWSYKGATGPSHWHELFPKTCSGNLQSPINIKPEETIYHPELKDFAIWYDPPTPTAKMFVKNNGHAVQIDTIGDFYVTNAGLWSIYKTAQFHFHWGHADHHGSEHHIDGRPHPLELHIVNFDYDRFGTISEAVTQPQGLAVLGVLFEIVDEDNKVLQPIIEAMEEVRDPDEEKLVEIKAVSLRDLLPEDTSRYFRYNGSLTTPGCFESVVWTVFERPQKISIDQLLEFRKILKPRFKKHKAGKNKHHRRHIRRSAAEKNAEKVLDEMGITGNHMAEDELKADLMAQKAKEAESSSAAAIPEEVTTEAMIEDVELDEDSAKRAEENVARHMKEKIAEEEKSREEHMKKKENEDYIQELLVNNFRPVQPTNNRLIHRSYKLSVPPTVLVGNRDGPNSPHYEVRGNRQGNVGHSTDERGSAGQISSSVITLLITSVLSLFYITS